MSTQTPAILALHMNNLQRALMGAAGAFRVFPAASSRFQLTRIPNNLRFTVACSPPLVVRSRNKREGKYLGKLWGRHRRAKS